MGFENLPQPIKDEILGKNKERDSYYDRKDNEIHITETLYCLTKAYYNRVFPIEPEVNQAFWLYRGNMLDEAFTSLFRQNQMRCTHKIPNIPASLVGKFDFVDGDTLYDLKTTKNLFYIKRDGPKPQHMKQLQFYCYENSIPKAKLIYFDFGDCEVFDVPIDPNPVELIKELEQRGAIIYNALQSKIPPKIDIGKETWMCATLDYKKWEIKKNEFGKDSINCPYFYKCYKSNEEFVQSVLGKKPEEAEPITIEVKEKKRGKSK